MRLRPIEPRQFGTAAPSAFENELADILEDAFGRGVHDLAALVATLNASPVRPPDGAAWTEDNFKAILHELGR
jgi:hypothetical protein